MAAALRQRREWLIAGLVAIAGAGLVVALAQLPVSAYLPPEKAHVPAMVLILTSAIFAGLAFAQPMRQLVYVAIAASVLVALPTAMSSGHSERSFFGVLRVNESPDGRFRVMMHGTTNHGVERIRNDDGSAVTGRPVPAAYYHDGSPLAHALTVARAVATVNRGAMSAGIVGLGTGSMACFARPDESWRFYEIDPAVVALAKSRFSFLNVCPPAGGIVLGDARLTVAKEPAATFDYLQLDAFSSDAIPVHLMTREAIAMFLDKLTPNGILAVHISNRHMELATVIAAIAQSLPGVRSAVATEMRESTYDRTASKVMFLARSPEALAPILSLAEARPSKPTTVAPWTDDFSDVLSAILRQHALYFR